MKVMIIDDHDPQGIHDRISDDKHNSSDDEANNSWDEIEVPADMASLDLVRKVRFIAYPLASVY